MPRIFDNIETGLLPTLKATLESSHRSDFCVGYFNLRGWRHIAESVEQWAGTDGNRCRLLVGMPTDQEGELRRQYSLLHQHEFLDPATKTKLQHKALLAFREQLTFGTPNDADQHGLRQLRKQLLGGQLQIKLHLRYPLHAKLYLCHREDLNNPITGFLGSSNLTNAGLQKQGELNVDVMDHDATEKLQRWFKERWEDQHSLDITQALAELIHESWITPRDPYPVYIKMAYHLSREARAGVEGFDIPYLFRGKLFEFQAIAVKIAAHHLDKVGGVMLGDVVGLGKTIMASAVAKLYIERHGAVPLIICPPNLIPMWEKYSRDYDLYARVLSSGSIKNLIGEFSRHKLVIVDESHNFRNHESKSHQIIKEFISDLNAKVILLSATPYNKGYTDISAQLRLFLNESSDLGIRPEEYLKSLMEGETTFGQKHQFGPSCLKAFEASAFQADWQQLMQKFMVRRTRTFIKAHYAKMDEDSQRRYLPVFGGSRAYFPDRTPHTIEFHFDETQDDPYAKLYSDDVVDVINHLTLPRYGLANYLDSTAGEHANNKEGEIMKNLGRAGKRLMGFCRTNLYKRLESSGEAFLKSVQRHVMRNLLFAYAIENDLPMPIGAQDPSMLDTAVNDTEDEETVEESPDAEFVMQPTGSLRDLLYGQDSLPLAGTADPPEVAYEKKAKQQAEATYKALKERYESRFAWIRPQLFTPLLRDNLIGDARDLIQILVKNPKWDPTKDQKLAALLSLIQEKHPKDKVLVFTQYADTAEYLFRELAATGVQQVALATGQSKDLAELAARFSPTSNEKAIAERDTLRVLISTDVLSEGQNLQDGHVIVNFDLPWAIIRLVQRAGRVDRIGQQSPIIHCYSFVPMKGIEQIIKLRAKVRNRLKENQEVLGSDEAFFDDDGTDKSLLDLYNEKSGILDGAEDESEVDLQSRAYQIVQEAIEGNPALADKIKDMPDVVYATKEGTEKGVIVYVRTANESDALALVGPDGKSITENQSQILDLAKCEPNTPGQEQHKHHHKLVADGVTHLLEREKTVGGSLGRPSSARYRAYYAIKRHLEANERNILIPSTELGRAMGQMLGSTLLQGAIDAINRDLKRGAKDGEVADLVYELFMKGLLCPEQDDQEALEPRIICSLGLA